MLCSSQVEEVIYRYFRNNTWQNKLKHTKRQSNITTNVTRHIALKPGCKRQRRHTSHTVHEKAVELSLQRTFKIHSRWFCMLFTIFALHRDPQNDLLCKISYVMTEVCFRTIFDFKTVSSFTASMLPHSLSWRHTYISVILIKHFSLKGIWSIVHVYSRMSRISHLHALIIICHVYSQCTIWPQVMFYFFIYFFNYYFFFADLHVSEIQVILHAILTRSFLSWSMKKGLHTITQNIENIYATTVKDC